MNVLRWITGASIVASIPWAVTSANVESASSSIQTAKDAKVISTNSSINKTKPRKIIKQCRYFYRCLRWIDWFTQRDNNQPVLPWFVSKQQALHLGDIRPASVSHYSQLYALWSGRKQCESQIREYKWAQNCLTHPPNILIVFLPLARIIWHDIGMYWFDFLLQQDCEYDHVEVRSKLSENELRKHGVFCGTHLPPVVTSEGNVLRIEFASDNSVQKTGFAAVYFTGSFTSW